MDEWERVMAHKVVDMHRSGWRGLWDRFVSIVRREPQKTILTQMVFSAWVKSDGKVRIQIENGQDDRR